MKPKAGLTKKSTPSSHGSQMLFNQPPLLCFCHMHVLLLQQEIIEGRKSSKPPHRLPESIQKELDKRSIGDRLGIQLHSV